MMRTSSDRTKKIIIKSTLFGMGILLTAVLAIHFSKIILGPRIVLAHETIGPITDSTLSLAGRVKNTAMFRINGHIIPLDEQGTFNEILVLPDGYSIIVLEAEDRFGREVKKTFSIARTAEQDSTQAPELIPEASTETAQTLPVLSHP